jgi:hypothetical protein
MLPAMDEWMSRTTYFCRVGGCATFPQGLLTSPSIFFSSPQPHRRPTFAFLFPFRFKKWTTCSTVPSVLILEPHTRKIACSACSFQPLIEVFACSCVGVWQNDRVEIIANDREYFSHVVFLVPHRMQRETARHHHMLLSQMRSA